MSNKGFIGDVGLIMIVLFVFSITLLIAYAINTEFYNTMSGIDTLNQTYVNQSIGQVSESLTVWDGLFVFIYVGFVLLTIGGAWFIKTNPLFFIFGIIGLIFLTFLGGIISNVYEQTANVTVLQNASNTFTYTSFTMLNMPPLILIGGALVILILFAKVINP